LYMARYGRKYAGFGDTPEYEHLDLTG